MWIDRKIKKIEGNGNQFFLVVSEALWFLGGCKILIKLEGTFSEGFSMFMIIGHVDRCLALSEAAPTKQD